MSENVQFNDMKEPVNIRWVNDAGIYRGFKLKKLEYVGPNAEKKLSGYVEETFEHEEGLTYMHRIWHFAEKPEDVKYFGKLYKDGVIVRDKTASETIDESFTALAYHFCQLGMAYGKNFEEVKKLITAEGANFVKIVNLFKTKIWDLNKEKLIDFKVIWRNNDSKKTSFLLIPDAGYRSLLFAANTKDTISILSMSPYEKEKCSKRKYQPKEAPANDNVETSARPASNEEFDAGNVPDSELF